MKKIFSGIFVVHMIAIMSLPQLMAQDGTEDQIKSILIKMWDAVEKKDIDKYSSYLHQDYTSFGENNFFLNEGKALEIRNAKEWWSKTKFIHTDMHNAKVTVNGNVAWMTYYWTDYGVENEEPFSSKGKSSRIFVKENGKWLCIHAHFTLIED